MVLAIVWIIISLVVLYFGANFLVKGSSSLAVWLGISPLVVGLTVVALGTSAPELVVSVQAAWNGASGIVVGNVIGSNIFNVCIILGISAMICPLQVNRHLLRWDMPILLLVSLVFVFFFREGNFGRLVGILFLVGILSYTFFCVYKAKKGETVESDESISVSRSRVMDIGWIILGLVLLVWGSDLLVEYATVVARELAWSEAMIGLTIVAAGTSMPELATSVVAAVKKRSDIAIGNVVGSNIFNLLAVLGAAATISPIETQQISMLDMGMMLGTSCLLLPFMRTGFKVGRGEGCVLFMIYCAYTLYLLS